MLALIGCNNTSKTANTDIVNIEDDSCKTIIVDTANIVSATDLILDIEMVKLATSAKCFIGKIDQMLFAEDKIIIVDKRKSRGVFVFNIKGKFLNRIGEIGRGPKEFIAIDHVALIPSSNDIAVLDRSSKKINIFDLKGNHKTSLTTPFFFNKIEYITEHETAASVIGRYPNGNEEKTQGYSLFTFNDWSLNDYAFKDPFSLDCRHTSDNTLSRNSTGRVYFTPPFENKIYRVQSNKFTLLYDIDFLNKGIPKTLLFDSKGKDFSKLLSIYSFFDGIFCDLRDFVLLKVARNQREETLFYSKHDNKTYFLGRQIGAPLENYFNMADIQFKDDVLVSPIDAVRIVREEKWVKGFAKAAPQSTKINNMIDELYNKISEDDNPVLFFYKIKQRIDKD